MTIEWVALAAAVIILAIGTVMVIQSQLNTVASTISSAIVSTIELVVEDCGTVPATEVAGAMNAGLETCLCAYLKAAATVR